MTASASSFLVACSKDMLSRATAVIENMKEAGMFPDWISGIPESELDRSKADIADLNVVKSIRFDNVLDIIGKSGDIDEAQRTRRDMNVANAGRVERLMSGLKSLSYRRSDLAYILGKEHA